MFSDAKPVENRAVAARGVKPRSRAQVRRVNATGLRRGLGRMTRISDEARPGLEIGKVAAFANERLVHQAFGDDDMRQGIEDGDVGSGLQGEVIVGLDVRALDQIDAARIDDDETRARAQTFLEARRKDRMGIGRIGADDDHDVRLCDRLEILRAGRCAEGLGQTEAGR